MCIKHKDKSTTIVTLKLYSDIRTSFNNDINKRGESIIST